MDKYTKGQILIGVAIALTSASAFAEPLRIGPLSDGYRSYAFYDVKHNKRWGKADPASCSNMLSYLNDRHLVFMRDFAKSNVAVTDIAVDLVDGAFFAGSHASYQGFFYMGSGAEIEFIPVQYVETSKNTFHFTYDRAVIGLKFDDMVSKAHSFVLKYKAEEVHFDLDSAPKNRKTFVKCLDNALKGNFTLTENESVSHLAIVNAMLMQNIENAIFFRTSPAIVVVEQSVNDVFSLLDRSFGDGVEVKPRSPKVRMVVPDVEMITEAALEKNTSLVVTDVAMQSLLDQSFDTSMPKSVPVNRVLLNTVIPKQKPLGLNNLATPSELDSGLGRLLDKSFEKETSKVNLNNRVVMQQTVRLKKEPAIAELKIIEPAADEVSLPSDVISIVEQSDMSAPKNQSENRVLKSMAKPEAVEIDVMKEEEVVFDVVEGQPRKLDSSVQSLLDNSFENKETSAEILNRIVPQKIIKSPKSIKPILKELEIVEEVNLATVSPIIPDGVASLIEQDDIPVSQDLIESRAVKVMSKPEPVRLNVLQEEEVVFDVIDEQPRKLDSGVQNLLDSSFENTKMSAGISGGIVESVDASNDVVPLLEQDEVITGDAGGKNRVLETEGSSDVVSADVDTTKEEEITFDDIGSATIDGMNTTLEVKELSDIAISEAIDIVKVDEIEKEAPIKETPIKDVAIKEVELEKEQVAEAILEGEKKNNSENVTSVVAEESPLNEGLNINAIDQDMKALNVKDQAVTIAEKGETDDTLRFKNILDGVRELDSTESYEILSSPSSEVGDKALIKSLTRKLKLLEAEKEFLRKRELKREMVGDAETSSTEEIRREKQKKKSKRWWPFPLKMKHVPFK